MDRIEQEQRLTVSHAFVNRYLPCFSSAPQAEKPSSEKSFYKFLCPLCLKLIFRCVTTVCGHSFCEVCLDEYLLIKPVSASP